MGNKLSKAATGGGAKRLSKRVGETVGAKDVRARPAEEGHQVNVPDPNKPRSDNGEKNDAVLQDGQDPQFADRLRQMGTVQYTDIETHYKHDNDLLSAVQAREQMQQENKDKVEDHTLPKSQTHPATIASILQSRKDGEQDDQLAVDYNLDSDFLRVLGRRYTIPDFAIEKKAKNAPKSLHQPEHGGKKPNLERIRPQKKFSNKTVEL